MIALYSKAKPLACPSPFNLADYVLTAGIHSPDKTAINIIGRTQETSMSYKELRGSILSTATGLLESNLKAGDKIALRLGNTIDFPIVFLAAIAVGICPVPLSSQLTARELGPMLARLNPKAICCDPQLTLPDKTSCTIISLSALTEFRKCSEASMVLGGPNRLAYMVFTSGTSGTPKAVMHAHRAVWARRMMIKDWYDLGSSDRMLHAGAFNWTYTLGTGLLDPWSVGATSLIPAAGTEISDIAALIAEHKATIFAAAPGVYRKILAAPKLPDMAHLRHGLSAGEKLAESIIEAWTTRTKTSIYEAFGMSECSTFVSGSPNAPAKRGTLGRPQDGRTLAILEPTDKTVVAHGEIGLIAIDEKDDGLMLGYYEDEASTAEKRHDTWFLTGDLGAMAADGSITYHGRNDDVMTAGGYRISPSEVEAAFQSLTAISSLAVTQVEIKPDVFVIAAFYVSDEDISETLLHQVAKQNLAHYKQPRLYVRCDALPTGPNGKLMRRALTLPEGDRT